MDKIKSYILSIMKDERKTPDAYIVSFFLEIASFVYLFLLKCVYFLYKKNILRSHKVKPRVISIGNITLGGTGKTPFTITLSENIKKMGRRVAVLTRGYGGDESHLLKEKLEDIPVLVGRDRVKNANKATELLSDCIVLDDGFQHYRIKRDLDIVLIDATCPFGNLKLFPRGILREPLSRLKDADIAILTKSDMAQGAVDHIRTQLKEINKKIDVLQSFYMPLNLKMILMDETKPLEYARGKKIALLSGIANPKYFDWMVGNLGPEIRERFCYPDHHQYSEEDISSIAKKCFDGGIRLIITTEKDAVRLRRLKNIPDKIEILALRINFRISSNEEAISRRLHSIFNS